MTIPITQVDAFTARPFGGNPAAICILAEAPRADWMQSVAAEMNLAETAFLVPKDGDYDLRWFTPRTEVDLCGHATLAAAHVLWEDGVVGPDTPCRFHTRSGLLTARRDGDWIRMTFPLEGCEAVTVDPEIEAALGVSAVNVGKNRLQFLLMEAENASIVRELAPNFATLGGFDHHGYIVTSQSDSPDYDFISRFFAPKVGIDEDPVTGSAHCVLARYWSERLGKTEFTAYQASRRGGVVKIEVDDPRCHLSGQAVTVLRGNLLDCASTGR